MGMSKNIGTYGDVAKILTAAKKAGGGRVKLASPGQARRWQQRAYYYRKLLLEEDAIRNIMGGASTPFDDMIIRLDGDEVVVRFDHIEVEATDLDGNPLDLTDVPAKPRPAPKLSEEEQKILDEAMQGLDLELE